MDPIDLAKSVKPITAYHGSPHDFDKFDTSKMGTGEGNQSYGHGLYFAESEPIARHYRDALTKGADNMMIDGERFFNHYTSTDPEKKLKAKLAINMLHGDRDIQQSIDWQKQQTMGKLSSKRLMQEDVPFLMDDLERLKQYKENPPKIEKNPGHMYEVAIDAHPDHFLDWDKPLSEQSEHVRNAIRTIAHNSEIDPFEHLALAASVGRHPKSQEYSPRGIDLYSDLDEISGGKVKASEVLQAHGIHGIKYLDEGSRGKPWIVTHPQGGVNEFNNGASARAFHARNPESSIQEPKLTSNYVVFDHNRVNVKRKYEQGGSVRRPYKKGGKVEGSIWHNKDVEYGEPTDSAIVQHALDKIAAPLPASILHQGSVTGRRH